MPNTVNPNTNPDTQGNIDPNTTQPPTNTQPPVTTTPAPVTLEDLLKDKELKDLLQIPAFQQFAQTIRSEEKDKLYKTIGLKEDELKKQQEALAEAQKRAKELEESNLTAEQKMQLQLEEMKKEQAAFIAQLKADKAEADAKAHAAELEAHKIKRLQEAQGQIIEGMVGGDSKEAIDASIVAAKAEYVRIVGEVQAANQQQHQQNVKNATTITNPAGTTTTAPLTAEEIARMSPDEYAKNRSRIMQEMRNGNIK